MDAEQFEEMCCALLEKEPAIKKADRYHVQRQQQFGIDIIGERSDGEGIEVASCKCYSRLTKGQIATFSNEFLDHWDTHWHEKNVRRFILCVAVDVRSRQRQDEISLEHARFEALNVDHKVWGPRQLQERLRPHDGIVSQYLGEEWVPRLCGRPQPASAPPSSAHAFLDNVIVAQLQGLQAALSREVELRLEAARDRLRRGDRRGVGAELVALKADDVRWSALKPGIKARALRLEALLCLAREVVEAAEALADEADALAPAEEPRLRALIAYRHGGPQAALEALGEPKTHDGKNLKAAFLLESGDVQSALTLLRQEPTTVKDAEKYRLLAFALLMSGDQANALEAIREAERIAPDWVAVQEATAIVRYASALSPCVSFEPSAWPNPLPFDLVREDDTAQHLIEEAAEKFAKLLEGDLDAETKQNLETWRLACLASARTRASEAQRYFTELLRQYKTHAGVIAWGLARGYEFDHGRVRKALEDLLDARRGDPGQVLALAALHVHHDRPDKATATLERYGCLFQTEAEHRLLSHWQARVQALSKDVDTEWPRDTVSAEDALIILAARCGKGDNCEPLIQFAESHQRESALVYGAVQALAEAGHWDVVARYKDLLVDEVATASAVRLAAVAAFNSGDPQASLSILERGASAFPSCQLPYDMRRLQIAAARSTGDLAFAGRLASTLASQTRATPDILSQIQTKIEAGDLVGALPPVRLISGAEDLNVRDALMLSNVVRHADPTLAKDILRKAISKGVPDNLAGAAFHLTLTLGLGEEARPLYSALDAESAKGTNGNIKRVDVDEMAQILKRERERSDQLAQTYLEGKVPIHLVAAAGNTNLGKIFWRAFSTHRKGMCVDQPPLLIQHGSRRTPESFRVPFGKWRLHLDVTALIVADQLGLLEVLENQESPIVIPHMLPQGLLQLEQDARPVQPDRIQTLEEVVKKVDGAIINIAAKRMTVASDHSELQGLPEDKAEILLCAQAKDGLVVDYDPPPPSLSEPQAARIINLRAVPEALLELGEIDGREHASGLNRLGIYGQQPPTGQALKGQALFFYGNTIEVLAEAWLLEATIVAFDVYIEPDYLETAREEIRRAREGNEAADWLGQLRARIASGIEGGLYKLLPYNREATEQLKGVQTYVDAAEVCLFELLAMPPSRDAVIWIDDRCCNGYSNANGIPVVGITDVLAAMRLSESLDEANYYNALHRLRVANAGLIPPAGDEVQYHLDQAPMTDGRLIESPALRALRLNLSRMLLLEDHFDFSGVDLMSSGKSNELWWLLKFYRIAEEVILEVWRRHDLDLTKKRAWSEWVWEALRTERFRRIPLLQATDEGRKHLFAMSLAALFSGALQLPTQGEPDKQSVREQYLQWLQGCVGPRFAADSDLLERVATILGELLVSLTREDLKKEAGDLGDDARKITTLLLKQLVDQLPEILRERLLQDDALKSTLGIKIYDVVQILGKSFPSDRFWNAIARVIRRGRASVTTLDRSGRMTLTLHQNGHQEMTARLTGGGEEKIRDPIFDLLADDIGRREQCLREHEDWLDLPLDELEARIDDIVATEDPAERVRVFEAARNDSAAYAYKRLSEALVSKRQLPWSFFHPPSAEALVRYLRVSRSNAEIGKAELTKGSKALVSQCGALTAFRRFAGLPGAMPTPILKALTKLKGCHLQEVREELTSTSGSPLRMLHRLAAMTFLREKLGLTFTDIQQFVDALLSDWHNAGAAFLTVLRWTGRVFHSKDEWSVLPASVRTVAVWIHAEQITSILLDAGASAEWIVKCFDGKDPLLPKQQFVVDLSYERSAGWPERITPEGLLFYGFGVALGNEPGELLTLAQRGTLKQMLTTESGGLCMPLPMLLQDRRNADNPLGLFLVQRPVDLMVLVDDPGIAEKLGPKGADDFLEYALNRVEKAPNKQDGWLYISTIGVPWLRPKDLKRVVAAARSVNLADAVGRDERIGLLLFRILAEVAVYSGDSNLKSVLLTQLEPIAELLGSRYSRTISVITLDQKEPDVAAAVDLAEIAFILSKSEQDLAGTQTFAEAITRIIMRWPASAPVWRLICQRFLDSLPFEWTESLWQLYVKLRTLD